MFLVYCNKTAERTNPKKHNLVSGYVLEQQSKGDSVLLTHMRADFSLNFNIVNRISEEIPVWI